MALHTFEKTKLLALSCRDSVFRVIDDAQNGRINNQPAGLYLQFESEYGDSLYHHMTQVLVILRRCFTKSVNDTEMYQC